MFYFVQIVSDGDYTSSNFYYDAKKRMPNTYENIHHFSENGNVNIQNLSELVENLDVNTLFIIFGETDVYVESFMRAYNFYKILVTSSQHENITGYDAIYYIENNFDYATAVNDFIYSVGFINERMREK